MATRYTFTDDSGDVRISGFLTPEPAGTFNGGTITNGLTIDDGAAGDYATLLHIEVNEGVVLDVDGGGEVSITQRDAGAAPFAVYNRLGGTLFYIGADGSVSTPAPGGLGFFNVSGATQPIAIANAAGGVVIDAEARTALNALLAAMRVLGLIAT